MTNYYSTLMTDARLWMARTDISDEVTASCIRMAEAEIWKRIKTFEMEADTTLVFTDLDFYETPVPEDWLSFRRVRSDLQNPRCSYVSPDVFSTLNNSLVSEHERLFEVGSLVYTVEGGMVKINQPTGSGVTITLYTSYFRRFNFPNITPTEETNPVLELHYDLYMHATLMKLWEFADEDSEIAKYEKKMDKAIAQIMEFERTRRTPSSGPLIRRSSTRPLA